jgi:hypothetical protein
MTAIVERVVFQAETGSANAAIRDVNVNLRGVAKEAATSQRSLTGLGGGLNVVERGMGAVDQLAKKLDLKGTLAEGANDAISAALGLVRSLNPLALGLAAVGTAALIAAKQQVEFREQTEKTNKALEAQIEATNKQRIALQQASGNLNRSLSPLDPAEMNLLPGDAAALEALADQQARQIEQLQALAEKRAALMAEETQLAQGIGRPFGDFVTGATDDRLAEIAKQKRETLDLETATQLELRKSEDQYEAAFVAGQRRFTAQQTAAEQRKRADQSAAEATRKAAQEQQRYADAYKALVTDPQIEAATRATAERLGVEAGLLTRLTKLTDLHRQAVLRNDQDKIAGLAESIRLTQREIDLQAQQSAAEAARRRNPGIPVPNVNMAQRVGPNGEGGGIFAEINKPAGLADDQAATIATLTGQVDGLAVAWGIATTAQYAAVEAARAYDTEAFALTETLRAGYETTKLVVGGFGQLGAGIVQSLEQSVTGQVKFGKAMAQVTKGILLGIAQEAAARALMAAAQGTVYAFTPGLQGFAAGQFAAAGIYTGVAVAFGAGGLALAAANRDNGGAANAGPQRTAATVAGANAPAGPSKLSIELKIADGLYDPASVAKSFNRGVEAYNLRSAFA